MIEFLIWLVWIVGAIWFLTCVWFLLAVIFQWYEQPEPEEEDDLLVHWQWPIWRGGQ